MYLKTAIVLAVALLFGSHATMANVKDKKNDKKAKYR